MAVLSSPKHENILDVIGYSATDDFRTVLSVTPRMVAGNLADYMQKEVVIHGKFELVSGAQIAGRVLILLMNIARIGNVGTRYHEWLATPA